MPLTWACSFVDVLTYTVPHRVTVAQARVAAVLIREHLRAIGHASRREAVQIGLARARHRGGADPPRRLVPCSGYRCLADRATARVAPVLGVFVLLQPAEERFIQFDRAIKQVGVVGKALADTVREVPCRLLRNAQVAVYLHTARALQAGRHDMAGDGPILVADLRGLHGRSVLD